MTKKTSWCNYFFIFSVIVIFVSFPVQAKSILNSSNLILGDGDESSNLLIIAERDVLSFSLVPRINETANLTLLIFHEAWIFNTYNQSKTITVEYPISKEKYRPLSGYPAFGKKYLIQQSSIPNYFNPKATRVLDRPAMIERNNTVNFEWENVIITPHEAVIIAYANEYQNGSEIYNAEGIEIPGIYLRRTYDSSNSVLVMNYSMENTEKFKLHSPKFILFFPESVNNNQIFQPSDITIKSNCRMDIFENTSYNDGSGYFSSGHMMLSHCSEYLDSAHTDNFLIEIKGKSNHLGKLIPSLVIAYRVDSDLFNQTGEVKRIWPAININSEENLNITRFYYYEASLAIPENKFFMIIPDKSSKVGYSIFNNFIFSTVRLNLNIDKI